MGKIDSKLLFITTSPRTPEKMIPEIDLLTRHFSGKKWNAETQRAFMNILREEQFFNGKGENDPTFSARDRINRAPKSLGFVKLSPEITLTPAGEALLTSKRKDEVFLRQLLKFQIPSPYHKPSAKATTFCVKPYLELLRLVRNMGTLKFDELQIFGMQLTDWHKFDLIVRKIEKFRIAKVQNRNNYRTFKNEYLKAELMSAYNDRIRTGETHTRESRDSSLRKFLDTQSSNTRDYADACFRYLRATGLVNVSHTGKSLSIVPEKIEDVDYILQTVDREPCFVNDENGYVTYLGNVDIPKLLTDNKSNLIARAMTMLDGGEVKANLNFDDFGHPVSTAQGNMADIICDYGNFIVIVETTLSTGQKQYEMESEPVSRHLGKIKKASEKPCYCLFVAPSINEACIAHFYALHNMNISYYGGKSAIIPLPLHVFRKMLEDSRKASYTPRPEQVKAFFDYSEQIAHTSTDEKQWYEKIQQYALDWLAFRK